ACDIGIKPVNIPIIKRRKKRSQTELAKPINKTDNPIPAANRINIFFLPNLSPTRPQMGEKINAVPNVMPKIHPDQFCTYASEKFPNSSIYSERNGSTIVRLPPTKKFANHMIIKFRLT